MITIYAKNNCGWCTKAKETAEEYGLKYEYKNVEDNFEYMMELSERKPDVKTMPQIWWHDRHIGGYTEFAKEIEDTRSYGDGQV